MQTNQKIRSKIMTERLQFIHMNVHLEISNSCMSSYLYDFVYARNIK